MAAIDRLAALWSAAIVTLAVGVTLAMSSAGPEPAGTDIDPTAPSALCESHGYEWSEKYDYCHMRNIDLCRDWGGRAACYPGPELNCFKRTCVDVCWMGCGF